MSAHDKPAAESARPGSPAGPRNRRRSESERRGNGRVSATFAVSEQPVAVAVASTSASEALASRPAAASFRVHLCQAEDIAVGGITIKHPTGLVHEPHTEVALRFALPGSREEIVARGEIVSDARAGHFRRTGVRFIAVRPEHERLIAAYCSAGS